MFSMLNFGNPATHKSTITITPLSSLKQITVQDLEIGQTHYGCYIKLTVDFAFQMASVQMDAFDKNNRKILLSVYNFPFKGKSYEHYFHKGVVLYVKEPFYKVTMSGTLRIRVDDPTDVEFENNQQKNTSLQNKKAEGRELVKKQKFIEAYTLYDDLLKSISNDKDKVPILINKAIMCAELNLKKEYQENLEKALKIDPANEKAHFHLIKAGVISLDQTPTTQKFKDLIKKIHDHKYLSEQSKKDLKQFVNFHESFQRNQKIDWYQAIKTKKLGEFWSPKIKVGQSPYGRGIFATDKIQPGEFLIIEKALGWIFFQGLEEREKVDGEQQRRFMMNWSSSDRFSTTMTPLFKVSQEFQKRLFSLSSAYYPGNKVNVKNRPKDRTEIESIFEVNAFTAYELTNIFNNNADYDEKRCYDVVYEKLCLLNHRCENNCDRFNIGTSGILYATREINPGEELFIQYRPIGNLKQREENLKHWGIYNCACLLCREQRGEKVDEKEGSHIRSSTFQKDL